MSNYEAAVTMMRDLQENDLLIVKELIERLLAGDSESEKSDNISVADPYKALTREEILEQLKTAREHAENGMVLDAHKVSNNIREKYGL